MKLTFGEWLSVARSINAVANKGLPLLVSFRLARLHNALRPELAAFEAKRFELVKKYGQEVEAGRGEWRVKPENADAYLKEYEQLAGENLELPFTPLTLALLGGTCDFSTAEMLGLQHLIEDEAAAATTPAKKKRRS